MRILAITDAGCHSGFATVAENVLGRLVTRYGHDVHAIAVNYRGDHWDTPLKLYLPTLEDPNDVLGMSRYIKLTAQLMPDAIVFINDPKVVLNCLAGNPWDPERVLWRGLQTESGAVYRPPILAYLAIDGYESPRQWDALADRVTRIAMSHHGQTAMPEAPVVWHGVDTTVYHPRDRAEAKAALGLDPQRFLVLRVDKNTWRKDYPASWKALRPVLRRHPDIDVWWHTRPTAPDGYDLNAMRFNDEDVRDRVTMSADLGGFAGWPEERLALLFSAADLFLSTSWGEGFGLTLLQAAASGTPVLAQDCSSIPEVVGPGGVLVKPAGRITVPMGQEQCLPDIEKFSYWIERLYESPKMRESLGRAGAEHATQFSWDVAAAKFDAILTREVAKTAQP
jgi:glycosyltransferase involved in cell wall biosynthesis